MSDELFRQDGKNGSERAVVQGDDASKKREKHDGPVIGVDFYKDRFERVDPGRANRSDSNSHRTPMRRVPDYSSSQKLKDEIAEVASLGLMTWDLPVWRPAELSREIMKRLADTIHQLKVVMRASDSLSEQVEALYEVEKTSDPSEAEETTSDETAEEAKDE